MSPALNMTARLYSVMNVTIITLQPHEFLVSHLSDREAVGYMSLLYLKNTQRGDKGWLQISNVFFWRIKNSLRSQFVGEVWRTPLPKKIRQTCP